MIKVLTTLSNNSAEGVTSTGLLKTPSALSPILQVVEDYAGTDSPLYLSTTKVEVASANIAGGSSTTGNFNVKSTTAYGINLGGYVTLGGKVNSNQDYAIFGAIAGRKENATNDDYLGYLALYYSNASGNLIEGMRLNSSGNVGIGTTTPSYTLDVSGTGRYTGLIRGSATTSNSAGTGYFQDGGGYTVFRIDSSSGFNMDAYNGSAYYSALKIKAGANADILITPNGTGKLGINNTSPTGTVDIVAALATVGLLVKGSDTATFYANIQNDSGTSRFNVGVTGTNVNTRDGSLVVGFTDNSTNSVAGLRLLTLGTGSTYIDSYSEGTSKAANFDIIIGSRRNATNVSISGNTTAETGSNVQIGYETATIPSSVLTLNTVTRGFLPPRMTTTQKNAIASPATGLEVYDTNLNGGQYYDGTGWRNVIAGDNSNLFWDNTNKRLGIGTTSPANLLHLNNTSGWNPATTTAYQLKMTVTSGSVYLTMGTDGTYNYIQAWGQALYVNGQGQQTWFGSGKVGVNNTSPSAQLDIVAAATTVGLYVKGAASTDIARFYTSANVNVFNISSTGIVNLVDGTNYISWGGSSQAAIRGNGQVLEARTGDNSNFCLFRAANTELPTGGAYYWAGRSEMYSPSSTSIKLVPNSGTAFSLLLGGATSAFPMWKIGTINSIAAVIGRDAVDGGYAAIQGKLTTDTNATTGLTAGVLAALTNASIVIYDSTGQAYRVPVII